MIFFIKITLLCLGLALFFCLGVIFYYLYFKVYFVLEKFALSSFYSRFIFIAYAMIQFPLILVFGTVPLIFLEQFEFSDVNTNISYLLAFFGLISNHISSKIGRNKSKNKW